MSKGHSLSSFGAIVNVCRTTIYNWRGLHESFDMACKVGYAKSQYYHEQIMLIIERGYDSDKFKAKDMNFSACSFVLKTVFHHEYGTKVGIDHTNSDNSLNRTIDLTNLTEEQLLQLESMFPSSDVIKDD